MILPGSADRDDERGVTEGGGRDLTGRQLGPYRLEAHLGNGGVGHVYRARHITLDIPRAVKVVPAGPADDPDARERFLREARTAAQLHHPNIVAVFDFGAEAGIQYLVMEYVESTVLGDHLSRMPVPGRLGDPAVRRWIRDVAMGLDHAHAYGIVHRDLKPANVLVRSADGRAMVTDFGIAEARADGRRTAAGRPDGTYAYLSPEQCEGTGEPTSACDVYALAAMLYEIATGDPPFGRDITAVSGHIQKSPPALRLKAPDLPSGLAAVFAKGLAKAPGDRYQTAGELVSNVLVAMPERQAEPEPAPGPQPEDGTMAIVPSPTWEPPSSPVVLLEPEPPPARRWTPPPLPDLRVVAVVAAAALGVTLVVAIVRAVQPAPVPPPPAVTQTSLPAPVRGVMGTPMELAGSRVTVVAYDPRAAPPAGARVNATQRFVVVNVQYQAGSGGGVLATPYDWVLSDDQGTTYPATVEGLSCALPERTLRANETVRGRLAFVVPRTATGLVLQYDAQLGDQAARVPLG